MLLIQLQGPFQAIVGIAAIPPEKEGQRAFRPDRPDMAAFISISAVSASASFLALFVILAANVFISTTTGYK